jgi:hypothetical protein
MPTVITDAKAAEQSTFIIPATFYDEEGVEVLPKTLKWSLCDRNNAIVNDREDIEVAGGELASTMNFVLSGEDLAILAGKSEEQRFLVLEATYDSTLGDDLPLKDQAEFTVVNLKKVT